MLEASFFKGPLGFRVLGWLALGFRFVGADWFARLFLVWVLGPGLRVWGSRFRV